MLHKSKFVLTLWLWQIWIKITTLKGYAYWCQFRNPYKFVWEQGIWSQNSHSSFGLDQENDHHTKAIVHQEVWEFWDCIGNIEVSLFGISLGSLWDHIGNIWTQEKSRNFIHHATLVHFGSMLHTPCSTSLFETLSNDHLNLANSIYMSHWKHVKGSKWLNAPKCSIMIFGNHFWNSFTTMDSCMNVWPNIWRIIGNM